MKKIILFLLAFFPQFAFAQWEISAENVISDNPIGHRVWSIKMVDENTIWAVSSPDTFQPDSSFISVVYKSVDGGETYETFTIPDTETLPFYDISAIDDQTAFVTGNTRGLFKTTDGGNNWELIDTDLVNTAVQVHAFNENDIWVGTREGTTTFYVSDDGGISWTRIGGTGWVTPAGTSLPEYDPNAQSIFTVFSANSTYDVAGNSIIIGDSKGRYWLSEDKGYNWQRFETPFTENGITSSNITMVNPDTFMMASDFDPDFNQLSPVSIATTDGGETWVDGFAPVTLADIQDFPNHPGTFIAVSHAAFTGAIGTAITYNFGDSWEMLSFDPPLISMDFLNDSVGVATCCNIPVLNAFGGIYKWNFDFPTSILELSKAEISIEISPNPFVNDLNFKTNATENLTITITDVSGKIWQQFQNNGEVEFSRNLTDLPKGMYLVQVFDGVQTVTDRVVKQ